MTAAARRPFELRGWHVLALLLGFFAAIIAVNAAFITFAVRSFPGEDVRRSYLQGLAYNDTLAERRAQAALGWRAEASLTPGAEGAQLIVSLNDASGNALRGLTLSGELRRAAESQSDRALTFTPRADGAYVADLGAIEHGRWQVRAHAEDASGHALDFNADVTWRPTH